jgi:hypothetical protein
MREEDGYTGRHHACCCHQIISADASRSLASSVTVITCSYEVQYAGTLRGFGGNLNGKELELHNKLINNLTSIERDGDEYDEEEERNGVHSGR